MPQIEVTIVLPYLLRLENGVYSASLKGKSYHFSLQDVAMAAEGTASVKRTQISSSFSDNAAVDDEVQRVKTQEAEQLLRQTNRLLRWYRAVTGRATITELPRAEASPFLFRVINGAEDTSPLWGEAIRFEFSPLNLIFGQTDQSITQTVRSGLTGQKDPEVSVLFLLDAEQASREGRFREAVLFCWSAIDSTFSLKYKSLIQGTVKGENERESFTNFRNASMRYRMSAGLYFCTGVSIYDQPDALWENLTESYGKRNSIIHDGATAQEADAELALLVARRVISFLKTLTAKPQNKGSITVR